jgi:DNA-binding response OmpR family regulator
MQEKGAVLVVDDEAEVAGLAQEGLVSAGFLCSTAADARGALALLKQERFDIAIIDIDLPDMSGFELTRQAKRLCSDVDVIMITGFVEKFSYDEAIKAGAADFIKKPFTPRELLVRITQVRMNGQLRKSEEDLKKKVQELQEFYDIAVGRENRMLELKREIEHLQKELETYKKKPGS